MHGAQSGASYTWERFVEYPGARHGFDNQFATSLPVERGSFSSRDCRRVEVGQPC